MGNKSVGRMITTWILIISFIFLTASCKDETTEISSDNSPDSNTQWVFKNGEEQILFSVTYEEITLAKVLDFEGKLEQNRWLLSENSAYKGAVSLQISYSIDTRALALDVVWDKNKPVWPDVLSPYLAYQTPAFPFGQYDYYEENQVSMGQDATLIVYTGADADQVAEYEQTLLDNGYVHGADSAIDFYEKGTCFIEIAFHEQSGEVDLFVGQYEVFLVPLPPWPDPLPEYLQRILPAVAAMLTVTGSEDGFFASAEEMSLGDLYGFVKSAKDYYGWSALSDQNEMTHDESGFGLRMLSFDTETKTWTLTIYDAVTSNSTLPPDVTPTQTTDATSTQTTGDEIGVTDFFYQVTQGRYSDQNAMMGVLDEYGQYAEMADWNDIKALYGDNMTTFLIEAGVEADNDVWVQCGGERYIGNRHYLLARPSAARSDFYIYDQVGNEAWLGSWADIELPVLVKIPSDQFIPADAL